MEEFGAVSRRLLLVPDTIVGCRRPTTDRVSFAGSYGRGLVRVASGTFTPRGVAFQGRLAIRIPLHCVVPAGIEVHARAVPGSSAVLSAWVNGGLLGDFSVSAAGSVIPVRVPLPPTRYPLLDLRSDMPVEVIGFQISADLAGRTTVLEHGRVPCQADEPWQRSGGAAWPSSVGSGSVDGAAWLGAPGHQVPASPVL
jgi:hypothetical protein